MKKRILLTLVVIVIICSMVSTVYAYGCEHTYIWKSDTNSWVYLNDTQCTRYHTDFYWCPKCENEMQLEYEYDEDHLFGPMTFVGYYQGMQWWYQDCLNCYARVDYFFE